MNETEVLFLESLLRRTDGRLYFDDTSDGVLVPISLISHNHRDTKDPAEIGESVAWLANQPNKCIGLLNSSLDEFLFVQAVSVDTMLVSNG